MRNLVGNSCSTHWNAAASDLLTEPIRVRQLASANGIALVLPGRIDKPADAEPDEVRR